MHSAGLAASIRRITQARRWQRFPSSGWVVCWATRVARSVASSFRSHPERSQPFSASRYSCFYKTLVFPGGLVSDGRWSPAFVRTCGRSRFPYLTRRACIFRSAGPFLGISSGKKRFHSCGTGSGLSLGALPNYQESYLIIVPGFVLPLLLSGPEATPLTEWRARSLFVASTDLVLCWCILIGLAAWFEFNQWRFGVPYLPNRFKVGLMTRPSLGTRSLAF